jgi:hypothetical protein
MQFDWSVLGSRAPTALLRARILSHQAIQWAARAAVANLEAAPDDSHCSLEWDAAHGMLLSQPMPAQGGDIRVGLRIGGLALTLMRGAVILDTYELAGRRDSVVGVWLDSALRVVGLKSASGVRLPYSIPANSVSRGGAYGSSGEGEALNELAHWYGAAAEVLAQFQERLGDARPGAGPVRCWPHHFDIATLVSLNAGDAGTARFIGVGVSPGDEHFAQPYVYVSPWPRPDSADLPPLPAPGHWHTLGFVAAVVTGEEILTMPDRAADVQAFISAAFEIGRARLTV